MHLGVGVTQIEGGRESGQLVGTPCLARCVFQAGRVGADAQCANETMARLVETGDHHHIITNRGLPMCKMQNVENVEKCEMRQCPGWLRHHHILTNHQCANEITAPLLMYL